MKVEVKEEAGGNLCSEAPPGPGDDAKLCADGWSGPGCLGSWLGSPAQRSLGLDILTGKLLLAHKRPRDYYSHPDSDSYQAP